MRRKGVVSQSARWHSAKRRRHGRFDWCDEPKRWRRRASARRTGMSDLQNRIDVS